MLSPMRSIWPTAPNTSAIKIFVGLSGGVDSAVSAALLQKAGYDVTGVFIRIAVDGYPCTAGEDKLSAQRVAAHLKIPFIEVDLSKEYKQKVFDESIKEFGQGKTPNPDALCNREIKFGLFFDWCIQKGADRVATGHYAQVKSEQGSTLLMRSVDPEKDQSYFLWAVPSKKLGKTLFPIGHLYKAQVRTLAKKFGLPNAERKDSQGLCFLGPVSIDEMLHREIKLTPGKVLDARGKVVGSHEGAQAYTLGQRHGFVLAAHTPDTRPHYVVAKNIATNIIAVSPDKFPQTAKETLVALEESNWVGAVPDGVYQARYRYRQTLIVATKKGERVLLHEPHYIPEGQSLVLYSGERCMGGGVVGNAHVG